MKQGSEEVKNKKAVEKVVYIIENAIWINSHLLPVLFLFYFIFI